MWLLAGLYKKKEKEFKVVIVCGILLIFLSWSIPLLPMLSWSIDLKKKVIVHICCFWFENEEIVVIDADLNKGDSFSLTLLELWDIHICWCDWINWYNGWLSWLYTLLIWGDLIHWVRLNFGWTWISKFKFP